MKLIQKSQWVRVERYSLTFGKQGGCWYSFPCTKEGTPLTEQMPAAARENLVGCQAGIDGVVSLGVRDESYSYLDHAVGKCECGRTHTLTGFTIYCPCGRKYNGCGQLLNTYSLASDW